MEKRHTTSRAAAKAVVTSDDMGTLPAILIRDRNIFASLNKKTRCTTTTTIWFDCIHITI